MDFVFFVHATAWTSWPGFMNVAQAWPAGST